MLARLHLVRHGEVDNPDHLVYADLPGFPLSARGRVEAAAAAERLASRPIDVIVTSPLERAVETARSIADRLERPMLSDDRLIEWRLGERWAGVVWEELPEVFPGELEAYLDHPHDLPFAPESIREVGLRVADLVEELGRDRPGREVVLVSHQDPIQAGRLLLTGRALRELTLGKPGHGAVITLEAGASWREVAIWEPGGGDTFLPSGL